VKLLECWNPTFVKKEPSISYVVAFALHAFGPLSITTFLFSLYTLVRVITYTPGLGPPQPDPGFAPAGNGPLVFLGMEVLIILVALAQAVPFFVAGAIMTALTSLSSCSRILYVFVCASMGGALAAVWFSVCRGAFDAVAQLCTVFAAIGFLITAILVCWAAKTTVETHNSTGPHPSNSP
jgi:hypothetical protein